MVCFPAACLPPLPELGQLVISQANTHPTSHLIFCPLLSAFVLNIRVFPYQTRASVTKYWALNSTHRSSKMIFGTDFPLRWTSGDSPESSKPQFKHQINQAIVLLYDQLSYPVHWKNHSFGSDGPLWQKRCMCYIILSAVCRRFLPRNSIFLFMAAVYHLTVNFELQNKSVIVYDWFLIFLPSVMDWMP